MLIKILVSLFLFLQVMPVSAETCWNYVIEYPKGSFRWLDDCKGEFEPFETMMCGNKQGPALSEAEIASYQAWVGQGSPKTACQKYVPKDLCFEQVHEGVSWINGCKGNPDPHISRCLSALVPLNKDEKKKYDKWVKAKRPQTPCQRREAFFDQQKKNIICVVQKLAKKTFKVVKEVILPREDSTCMDTPCPKNLGFQGHMDGIRFIIRYDGEFYTQLANEKYSISETRVPAVGFPETVDGTYEVKGEYYKLSCK